MSLHYLFIDFNSYFASVEQQEHPELRGKPVAVVPVNADTTCCIAASYEAKRLGIKTGTIVKEAKKLCKDLHIIEATPHIYVEYHKRLVKTVESCLPVERVMSIDEMVCELIGKEREPAHALQIAKHIKHTIAEKVGTELRSSIGIAPNRFLAKTATDMQKPDGLVLIDIKDLPECLYILNLSDICGIGRAMKKHLNRHGIYTVKDLYDADKNKLHEVWGGIEGDRMYSKLRGETVDEPPTHKTTLGHSHVLPPEFRTEEASIAVLHRLLQKAAIRLRRYEYMAKSMYVKIKYLDGKRWRDEISFNATQDTMQLIEVLNTLLKRKPAIEATPLAVSVTLFKLIEEKRQTLQLLKNWKDVSPLNDAMDKINADYGKNTIFFGGAFQALRAAPMRIAFNHIPDSDV